VAKIDNSSNCKCGARDSARSSLEQAVQSKVALQRATRPGKCSQSCSP